MVWHGMVRHGMVWYGRVWYNKLGVQWYGMLPAVTATAEGWLSAVFRVLACDPEVSARRQERLE